MAGSDIASASSVAFDPTGWQSADPDALLTCSDPALPVTPHTSTDDAWPGLGGVQAFLRDTVAPVAKTLGNALQEHVAPTLAALSGAGAAAGLYGATGAAVGTFCTSPPGILPCAAGALAAAGIYKLGTVAVDHAVVDAARQARLDDVAGSLGRVSLAMSSVGGDAASVGTYALSGALGALTGSSYTLAVAAGTHVRAIPVVGAGIGALGGRLLAARTDENAWTDPLGWGVDALAGSLGSHTASATRTATPQELRSKLLENVARQLDGHFHRIWPAARASTRDAIDFLREGGLHLDDLTRTAQAEFGAGWRRFARTRTMLTALSVRPPNTRWTSEVLQPLADDAEVLVKFLKRGSLRNPLPEPAAKALEAARLLERKGYAFDGNGIPRDELQAAFGNNAAAIATLKEEAGAAAKRLEDTLKTFLAATRQGTLPEGLVIPSSAQAFHAYQLQNDARLLRGIENELAQAAAGLRQPLN